MQRCGIISSCGEYIMNRGIRGPMNMQRNWSGGAWQPMGMLEKCVWAVLRKNFVMFAGLEEAVMMASR